MVLLLKTVTPPGKRRGALFRVVLLGLGLLLAILIFVYAVYFYYVFRTFGSVTSFFPWRWQVPYSQSNSVLELTGIGIFVSVIVATLSIFLIVRSMSAYKKIMPPYPPLSSSRVVIFLTMRDWFPRNCCLRLIV